MFRKIDYLLNEKSPRKCFPKRTRLEFYSVYLALITFDEMSQIPILADVVLGDGAALLIDVSLRVSRISTAIPIEKNFH